MIFQNKMENTQTQTLMVTGYIRYMRTVSAIHTTQPKQAVSRCKHLCFKIIFDHELFNAIIINPVHKKTESAVIDCWVMIYFVLPLWQLRTHSQLFTGVQ